MLPALLQQCETLTHNYEILSAFSGAADPEIVLAAAGIFAAAGQTAEQNVLAESLGVLKSRTNILSEYRSTLQLITVCKMARSGNPAQYFERTDSISRTLRSGGSGSESAIPAALLLADCVTEAEECGMLAARTTALYRRMRSMHRFLTDEYDLPFAAVMAMTGRPHDAVMGDAEACFSILKVQKFGESNALQSLSHVLAMYPGSAADKCEKMQALRTALAFSGHPYPADGRLAMLGTLAGLPQSAAELAEALAEADDVLHAQPSFAEGAHVPRQDALRMYAAQTVQNALAERGGIDGDAGFSLSNAVAEAVMLWLVLMTAG